MNVCIEWRIFSRSHGISLHPFSAYQLSLYLFVEEEENG